MSPALAVNDQRSRSPLKRIDNTGCMFGVAGTCYQRRTAAWKSMLLLEHARGGWMNVYYGNLELIDDAKAEWFAKVQKTYFPLQSFGRTSPFGGLPGRQEPGGFCSLDSKGALYTVVNPSQAVRVIRLPLLHHLQPPLAFGRLQFRDAGYQPRLSSDELTLGPEQLAVVGYGEYAKPKYDLGVQGDVVIPRSIRPVSAQCSPAGTNAMLATLNAPDTGDLRIVLRQFAAGKPRRSAAGAPPNGRTLGNLLKIEASQNHRSQPVICQYDKAIWIGLSWAVGEVRHHDLDAGLPITIRCSSVERQSVELRLEFYAVNYDRRTPQARLLAVCDGGLVNDKNLSYRLLLPARLALAHLALASAASLALPAALNFLLDCRAGLVFAAIRFLTPARIFARPWALNLRFLGARVAG